MSATLDPSPESEYTEDEWHQEKAFRSILDKKYENDCWNRDYREELAHFAQKNSSLSKSICGSLYAGYEGRFVQWGMEICLLLAKRQQLAPGEDVPVREIAREIFFKGFEDRLSEWMKQECLMQANSLLSVLEKSGAVEYKEDDLGGGRVRLALKPNW